MGYVWDMYAVERVRELMAREEYKKHQLLQLVIDSE